MRCKGFEHCEVGMRLLNKSAGGNIFREILKVLPGRARAESTKCVGAGESLAPGPPEDPRDVGNASLLCERMRLLRLDPGYVALEQAEIFVKLRATCRKCSHKDQCTRDLDRGDGDALDGYCLNTATLDDLLIERYKG
jgi:hypothetical protein